MTSQIAILGAGPAGLLLGGLLHRAKVPFQIFERDESPRAEAAQRGGTLDLGADTGQLALHEVGLLEQFKAIARYDATIKIANAKGKVYVDVGPGEGDKTQPEIDRKALRALLLGSVPIERLQWGFRTQEAKKELDGLMSIQSVDGRRETGFRLVVGADGAWSKARSLVTPVKPHYVGLQYFTTTIPLDSPCHSWAVALAGNGLYIALGNGKQTIVVKLSDGSYHASVGFRVPENWRLENDELVKNPTALREWLLRDVMTDNAEQHKRLFESGTGGFHIWPLYTMPAESLSWKSTPGVTLVGDAAHLTPPFIGEGVNNALYDSLQLAQQIIKHGLGNLDEAVAEYEAAMLPRASDHVRRNLASGELLFAADAPRGWLKTFTGLDIGSESSSENGDEIGVMVY